MSPAKAVPVANRLIEGLSRKDRNRLLRGGETVELPFGQILCESGQPLRYAYFPLTAFISRTEILDDHEPLEMGLIGYEGLLGASLGLGVGTAPLRAIVQGAGTALRLAAAELRRQLRLSPSLLKSLHRYQFVLVEQLAKSAVCTHFHPLDMRLARCLLMTHDRAHTDHFHLTHADLAGMLGVRRSGVSVAAGKMQRRKLLRYTRGEIRILDRKGLEAASCDCYDAMNDDYARLLA